MILKQKIGNLSTKNYAHLASITQLLSHFSSDSQNIRVPLVHPTSHKLTDQYLFKYENKMFSAYVKKRKIPRTEIYPKMHVIDNIPQHEQYHLSYQKLYPLKKTLDNSTMERIIKEDPTKINSAYIMSMFIEEDGFKEMMDQYVDKVLVCGKAPGGVDSNGQIVGQQSQKRMEQIEDDVIDLYHIYYFGQDLSPLQREIEFHYLAAKQEKYMKKQMYPKNAYFRCIWRNEDQRLLEDIVNWPEVDLNLSDRNNRAFYEPFNLQQRLPAVKKFNSLVSGNSFFSNLNFQYKIKPNYTYSYNYLLSVVDKMMSRILVYIKCLEFTNQLQIPPDFSIEISMLNIHIWLITDRLSQFQSKQSKNLVRYIERAHKAYISNLLSELNLKKAASIQKKFLDQADLIARTLSMHFNGYEETKANPYKNIDALIWSLAFREKVQRYGDEVYRMSEYLVKNHELMKLYSEKDIFECMAEFDVFYYDPDYRQNIMEINPRLTDEEFEEQFNSNAENKSYYYKMNDKGGPSQLIKEEPDDTSYSFMRALGEKIGHFIKKYMRDSKSYDHFSEMDEQIKEREKKARRSPWKGDEQKLQQMDDEFQSLQKIRRKKRRANLQRNKESQDDKN